MTFMFFYIAAVFTLQKMNKRWAFIFATHPLLLVDGLINGQKMHYDSKANVSKEEKLKYVEFETVSNTPFRARVNQKGEILEVTRIDKMVDKMMTLQPEMQKMTADQKASLIKNIGEGELKPRTQLLFRELTSNEVGKDSTWQKSKGF